MPYDNLPVALAKQGRIASPLYSIWTEGKDYTTGKILFGGVDHEKYLGNLSTFDIYRTTGLQQPNDLSLIIHGFSWDTPMPINHTNMTGPQRTAMFSNDTRAAILGYPAQSSNSTTYTTISNTTSTAMLLDTGTGQLILPDSVAYPLLQAFNLTYDNVNNQVPVDCDRVKGSETVNIHIGSLVFKVTVGLLASRERTNSSDGCSGDKYTYLFGLLFSGGAGSRPDPYLGSSILSERVCHIRSLEQ
jgi:hypothetical protein